MKKPRWLLLFPFWFSALGLFLYGQAELVSHKAPVYPLAAQAAGIEGPVTLKGIITKEGKMEDVHAVSGPPELRQAAVDAVSSWTYKPYKHFGRIVTVNTTVTVIFAMGKNPTEKLSVQEKAKAKLAEAAQQDSAPKL